MYYTQVFGIFQKKRKFIVIEVSSRLVPLPTEGNPDNCRIVEVATCVPFHLPVFDPNHWIQLPLDKLTFSDAHVGVVRLTSDHFNHYEENILHQMLTLTDKDVDMNM